MKNEKHLFKEIKPFELTTTYIEDSTIDVSDNHIHDECEIYINVSGDISFAVENSVYPVMPGDIIITRPLEYHHCICHSNKLHKHFWFLFSSEGNEWLFDIFFNRELGKNNLFVLPTEKKEELFTLCHALTQNFENEIEKYFSFFKLIDLINSACAFNAPKNPNKDCIIKAINHINANLSHNIYITEIAQKCNVSVNTLERRFLKELNTSPSDYIKKRRLANAIKLLSEGHSVTEAAEMSGFADCSNFILLFKKAYQTTPLKYQKSTFKSGPPAKPEA